MRLQGCCDASLCPDAALGMLKALGSHLLLVPSSAALQGVQEDGQLWSELWEADGSPPGSPPSWQRLAFQAAPGLPGLGRPEALASAEPSAASQASQQIAACSD